jgi:hypothetical protein
VHQVYVVVFEGKVDDLVGAHAISGRLWREICSVMMVVRMLKLSNFHMTMEELHKHYMEGLLHTGNSSLLCQSL